MMSEPLYSVTITALADSYARTLAARFLATVFKSPPEEEIVAYLATLPLLLTRDVALNAAETLRKHLEARGATVLLEVADSAMSPTPPSHELSQPRTVQAGPPPSITMGTATSYALVRPGLKDHVSHR